MKIGLISDTHGYLDPKVSEHFKNCDEIWHAGDFGEGVHGQLAGSGVLKGVSGNIDGAGVRSSFPEFLAFECEGMKVLLIHIAGPAGRYVPGVQTLIQQHLPGLLVCGHSHILKLMNDKKYNLLYVNPGAAGKQGFHRMRTILRFEIRDGRVFNLEVIELGLRAALV